MTTQGQDIAAAIREAATTSQAASDQHTQSVKELSGAVAMLALAVNNLSRSIGHPLQRDDPEDEPFRQPFKAWPGATTTTR